MAEKPKTKKSKDSKVAEDVSEEKSTPNAHPFSLSTTSVNKYDPYSLKSAIDEEIVEVSLSCATYKTLYVVLGREKFRRTHQLHRHQNGDLCYSLWTRLFFPLQMQIPC